jgi:hypothetical protein
VLERLGEVHCDCGLDFRYEAHGLGARFWPRLGEAAFSPTPAPWGLCPRCASQLHDLLGRRGEPSVAGP